MESSLFDKYNERAQQSELQATSVRQQLINEIVENMHGVKDKKATARRFAIAANTVGFSNQDLHYLSNGNNFPNIRNYSAFINSQFKVRRKKGQ